MGLLKKLLRGVRGLFRRRWFRRILVLLVVIGILVGIGAFGVHYINGPTKGTITAGVAPPTTPPDTQVALQGTYADFDYPSSFKVVPDGAPAGIQLAIYSFVSHQSESWSLDIQILSLPSGNISDDGSYHYRVVTPSKYSQVVQTINGQTVYIMTDNSVAPTYNKTAFFSHGTKIATVNLNGGLPSDSGKLDKILSTLIASWRWHS